MVVTKTYTCSLSRRLSRLFILKAVSRSFRQAFARGVLAYAQHKNINVYLKPLHKGFWCCSIVQQIGWDYNPKSICGDQLLVWSLKIDTKTRTWSYEPTSFHTTPRSSLTIDNQRMIRISLKKYELKDPYTHPKSSSHTGTWVFEVFGPPGPAEPGRRCWTCSNTHWLTRRLDV